MTGSTRTWQVSTASCGTRTLPEPGGVFVA